MAKVKEKTSKKEKKRLIIITSAIIGSLVILVMSVYNDWQMILENRKEEAALLEKYEYLLDEETRLNAEITKLGDDVYLKRYAREKYMLSKEGDTIIKHSNKNKEENKNTSEN